MAARNHCAGRSARPTQTRAMALRSKLALASMVIAAAVATVTQHAWLGFACCLVLAAASAVFAARLAYPPAAVASAMRTALVLGALAYLVGLPATWLVTRHVDALVSEVPELRDLVALPYLLFVFAFMAESGRRTDAPSSPTREHRTV